MSYSFVDISIEREDDGRLETTFIKNDKHVSDLLEESRWILRFKAHVHLTAHKIPSGERIDDSVCIRDIAHLGTVVIKCAGAGGNHENAANHQKCGLSVLPEKQFAISESIPHRGYLPEWLVKQNDKTTATMRRKNYDNEIDILNSKLNNAGIKGFEFKIIPEEYKHNYKEDELSLTFSSDEERGKKQTKVREIPNWSEWQPDKSLPCWGVKIDNNVSSGTSSRRSYRNKKRETSEIPTAIVVKTSFHQVKEFGVNVTINDSVVKEARKLLKVKIKTRPNEVKKFKEKYCSFVYSGKFSAGFWLRTVATAWRFPDPKEQDLTALQKCAMEKIERHWSWKSGRSSNPTWTNMDSEVAISLMDDSDPSNIVQMCEIEKKLKNVKNFAIFPANWAKKSNFTPVHEIMQRQAEETGDEDLGKVSDIFKENMEGM